MTKLLEIKDLHVYYRTPLGLSKVLNGVNLTLNKGETLGLIGESGCGKTTTLKTIMQILPTNAVNPQGEILLEGKDVLKASPSKIRMIRRKKLSMVFQNPTSALNPVFKVREQIMDIIKTSHGEISQEKAKALAEENLKKVGLTNTERILDSYPFQLSGGMKQRVCIALANVSAKNIILGDEPTTNLDVTIQNQVLNVIKDLIAKESISMILVSQALGLIRKMTDRIHVLYAGNSVETAESNDLFSNPLHPYTQGLLSSVPRIVGGGIPKGIPGRIPDYLDPPSGCRFYPRCAERREVCKEESPFLTDVDNNHKVACHLHGGGN